MWTQSTEPFQIAGPVYYVGSRELTSFLLVDQAGMLLINVGMAENVPLVFASIRKLGFDPKDIKKLLITQSHFDHAGGAALVQAQTGAEVLAGTADLALLSSGGLNDHVFGDELPFTPVPNAIGLKDGEKIVCGALVLETLATPGHTPGSCSWLFKYNQSSLLFQASISVLSDAVVLDNPKYPNLVQDFKNSFKRLGELKVDYILPDHLQFAHPAYTGYETTPLASWFQNTNILSQQIERAQKSLNQKLGNQQ